AVGSIPDLTGKEQYNDGGFGRFVTQGAGDMVQSALFKTGARMVNRRETAVTLMEAQWGIRDIQQQEPAHLLIAGSINSLDFIPGGGAVATIGGVGPRFRQNRILVGLDLTMTNLQTGQIVGSISLHKQIFANEIGFTAARIQGGTIVDADVGAMRREAVDYALRVMLQLATFELLTQSMPPEEYEGCRSLIGDALGSVNGVRTTGEPFGASSDVSRVHEDASGASSADRPVQKAEP
ncbi:CsgG/HfaB family protein, partial [Cereibacter changlensis]